MSVSLETTQISRRLVLTHSYANNKLPPSAIRSTREAATFAQCSKCPLFDAGRSSESLGLVEERASSQGNGAERVDIIENLWNQPGEISPALTFESYQFELTSDGCPPLFAGQLEPRRANGR